MPTVPEDGDIEFTDSDYFVVSAPNATSPKINTPSSSKINLEISLKLDEIRRLTSRIETVTSINTELDAKIREYRKEIKGDKYIEEQIEVHKKRAHEIKHKNNLIYKRYISKAAEIKIVKKKLRTCERKIWKIRNDINIKEMKLSLFKSCLNNYSKLNCFRSLRINADEVAYAITLLFKALKNSAYLKKAECQLEVLRSKINNSTEIEKFIPEFKRIFASKSKSVKQLGIKLKDLKSASMLQSQIIKIFRNK